MPLKGLLNWNINSQRFVFEEIFFWRKNNLTKVWSCRFVLDEVERFKRSLFAHPLYLSLILQIYRKLINLLKKHYKCICNVISNGFYAMLGHICRICSFSLHVYINDVAQLWSAIPNTYLPNLKLLGPGVRIDIMVVKKTHWLTKSQTPWTWF